MLGYQLIGKGKEPVFMLHNWFDDASSFETVVSYLDQERFCYVLVDLRGYGRSSHLQGAYTVQEVAADVLELADALQYGQFHILGHSMSGLFAQYLTVCAPKRIKRMVALTPVPACGSPMPAEVVKAAEAASAGNREIAVQFLHFATGNRLAEGFIQRKVDSFYASSTHEARMGYRAAFSDTNFEKEVMGNQTPTLVIAAKYDNPAYAPDAMRQTLLKWYPNAHMEICHDSGHFPNQEEPPLCAAYIERWLKR